MSNKRVMMGVIAGLAVLCAVAVFALVTLLLPPTAGPRAIDGVKAPDSKCVSDVEDLNNPWIVNGWWAGRVDGEVRQMPSAQAQQLSLQGHDMRGIWLCPPKT